MLKMIFLLQSFRKAACSDDSHNVETGFQARRVERSSAFYFATTPASTLTSSSSKRLSSSSIPASTNEFVNTALPFSTDVITYEHPIQCASARSVADHLAGWSGCE